MPLVAACRRCAILGEMSTRVVDRAAVAVGALVLGLGLGCSYDWEQRGSGGAIGGAAGASTTTGGSHSGGTGSGGTGSGAGVDVAGGGPGGEFPCGSGEPCKLTSQYCMHTPAGPSDPPTPEVWACMDFGAECTVPASQKCESCFDLAVPDCADYECSVGELDAVFVECQ